MAENHDEQIQPEGVEPPRHEDGTTPGDRPVVGEGTPAGGMPPPGASPEGAAPSGTAGPSAEGTAPYDAAGPGPYGYSTARHGAEGVAPPRRPYPGRFRQWSRNTSVRFAALGLLTGLVGGLVGGAVVAAFDGGGHDHAVRVERGGPWGRQGPRYWGPPPGWDGPQVRPGIPPG